MRDEGAANMTCAMACRQPAGADDVGKALGASSGGLGGMVLREGMVLVLVGGVLGALMAAAATRALASVLFVGAFDLVSFAVAFGVLAAVALVANVVPARRAARVDAMVALRTM